MKENEVVRAMQENRKPGEIRDFHPHTLRHTLATRCFEKKMEPKVVQQLMGHSNISVTLNVYTHVLDQKLNEKIDKFGYARTEWSNLPDIQVPRITAMSYS